VPDPVQTQNALVSAVRADDAKAAYALLDRGAQASVDLPTFERQWRENRGELLALVHELRRVEPASGAHSSVELENGERIALVLEEGSWRLQGGLLDAQALDTPLDAVLELRRALLRQSLPGLLRVLARERRVAWLAAFDKSVQQTSDVLDLRVEVRGDEAIVYLTGGGEVHLKREAGRWQVWDVK
jgi:hypothetical protein